MIIDNNYPHPNPPKYKPTANPQIVDIFKKLLNIQDRNEYHDNEVTKFYNKLLSVSKQLGLGENISIDTTYDGKIPEKVFTIHCATKLNKEQRYSVSELVHDYMRSFSKSEGLQDFFTDAYIIIK